MFLLSNIIRLKIAINVSLTTNVIGGIVLRWIAKFISISWVLHTYV